MENLNIETAQELILYNISIPIWSLFVIGVVLVILLLVNRKNYKKVKSSSGYLQNIEAREKQLSIRENDIVSRIKTLKNDLKGLISE